MIDMKAVYANVREWMENPYWKEYYETAPSEQCRKLIALEFWYSDHDCPDADAVREIIPAMEEAEKGLALEDWKHLDRFCGINPRKAQIRKWIEELGSATVVRGHGQRDSGKI